MREAEPEGGSVLRVHLSIWAPHLLTLCRFPFPFINKVQRLLAPLPARWLAVLGLENAEVLAGHSPSPEDHTVHCTHLLPELDIAHPWCF